MKYTSAEANKLLNGIQGRISDITRKEDLAASFRVASGEDVESLRPQYDFAATQKELESLEEKVRISMPSTPSTSHTLCPGLMG